MQMMQDLIVYVDESGNPGHGRGRYFTIACVVVSNENVKNIHRKMKRLCKKVKDNHPSRIWKRGEVKASSIKPFERSELIKQLPKNKINVFYIVIDKKWLVERMFKDKAISYNYWLRLVIDDILDYYPECKTLAINIDKRDIKVFSGNSFEDYLNIHLIYERNKDIAVTIDYPESHCNYGIQIADFISNGINYGYVSSKNDDNIIMNSINPLCRNHDYFPYNKFGL